MLHVLYVVHTGKPLRDSRWGLLFHIVGIQALAAFRRCLRSWYPFLDEGVKFKRTAVGLSEREIPVVELFQGPAAKTI